MNARALLAMTMNAAVAWGCASSPRAGVATQARFVPTAQLLPNLVLPSPELMEMSVEADATDSDALAWEGSRNDWRLGAPMTAEFIGHEVLEVRQREFLRTINGQPSEYSSTFTQTIKRGLTR